MPSFKRFKSDLGRLVVLSALFCFALAGFINCSYVQAQEAEGEQKAIVETVEPTENVTLDFKDADIRNVLKVIAYKSGVNIVATPEVMGVVTIRLQDVHWEQALDTIVKTYGFGYEWLSPTVIMVSTLERLAERRKAQQEAAANEPVDTQTFTLNFSRAADIKTAVEKLLSARGKISLEARTNTLIITDTKSNLMRIGQIVRSLDKITPQVMIEARIIETTLGSAEKLGIDWTMRIEARGAKRPTTLPFEPGGAKWYKNIFPEGSVPEAVDETVVDFPAPYSFPYALASDFTFGTLDFTQFRAVLEILDSRTDTNVISNPRITTLNNQEASIIVGRIVPIPLYQFSTETGTRVVSGYQDQEIGIKLVVTPNINEENYITLEVKPSVESIIGYTGPDNERPIISTRSAQTRVMIKDGETLVIGGLISENKVKYKKKVPFLGDIPLLGLLFTKKEDTTEKTDLIIFITPRIIREAALSQEEIS